jgi:hypothetical protein
MKIHLEILPFLTESDLEDSSSNPKHIAGKLLL